MLAPLRGMYKKYSTRGGVKWQIQHSASPRAVFAQDPTPSTVFFCTSQVNGALTDASGGLAVAVAMDLNECVQVNQSNSLLPQEDKMEYVC